MGDPRTELGLAVLLGEGPLDASAVPGGLMCCILAAAARLESFSATLRCSSWASSVFNGCICRLPCDSFVGECLEFCAGGTSCADQATGAGIGDGDGDGD